MLKVPQLGLISILIIYYLCNIKLHTSKSIITDGNINSFINSALGMVLLFYSHRISKIVKPNNNLDF